MLVGNSKSVFLGTAALLVSGALALGASNAGIAQSQSNAAMAAPKRAEGDCTALKSFQLENGRIVSAEAVKAPFETPGLITGASKANFEKLLGINAYSLTRGTARVPFCRVAVVLTPTPSSEIHLEVWLPDEGYTGRFAGLGNGGLTGAINFPSMARMLNRGYAVVSSDRGHTGSDTESDWAIDQPEKVIDFEERATHLATVTGKALVAKYYGKAADYSYWHGCSAGGGQAYVEARHYPADYDGYVAGAAPLNSGKNPADSMASRRPNDILGQVPSLTTAKLAGVTRAAVAACDRNDGVKDGVISDQASCKFDPAKLIRAGDHAGDGLTRAEADAIKAVYASGQSYGSEYYWRFLTAVNTSDKPQDQRAMMAARAALVPPPPAGQEYMQGFKARGGKFISYTGAIDPLTPPLLRYYKEIAAAHQKPGMSRDQAIADLGSFYRFFLIPGMEHCTGGPGPHNISASNEVERPVMGPDQDVVTAIEAWVEKGRAPDFIIATKYNGDDPKNGVAMTRPMCAYPARAKWNGKGDATDAKNFTCMKPPEWR